MNFHNSVKSLDNLFATSEVGPLPECARGADSGLIDALSYAYSALDHLVYLDPNDVFQTADYQQQLDIVIGVLSQPEVFVANDAVTRRIHQAVACLKSIGDARRDPAGSAQAFESLFCALGELAPELPAPVDESVDIFIEAEAFFESLRVDLQPQLSLAPGQWTVMGTAS
ncbi:MAG TPA: hypothetical protein PK359_01930 [Burkholderiaceae bacterium]|jgi:hypothetical protein|nr:hypothetical protein [Burkholderiaceae bacterium]